MSYHAFRWTAGLTVLVLVLALALWPLLSYGVGLISGCSRVPGACGAVLLMFGLYGRLALLAIAVFVMAIIFALRARRLNLPILIALPGAAALYSLQPIILLFNNFWAVGFSTGLGVGGFGQVSVFTSLGSAFLFAVMIYTFASTKRDAMFSPWILERHNVPWLYWLSIAFLILVFLSPLASFTNPIFLYAMVRNPLVMLLMAPFALAALAMPWILGVLWLRIGHPYSRFEAQTA